MWREAKGSLFFAQEVIGEQVFALFTELWIAVDNPENHWAKPSACPPAEGSQKWLNLTRILTAAGHGQVGPCQPHLTRKPERGRVRKG